MSDETLVHLVHKSTAKPVCSIISETTVTTFRHHDAGEEYPALTNSWPYVTCEACRAYALRGGIRA